MGEIRKSFAEILVLVDKEYKSDRIQNWNEIANKLGCQWLSLIHI